MSLLTVVKKNLIISWEMMKVNIASSMEYRTSFIVQVIGMIVNNIGLILLWVIFFQKFPEVNGWEVGDTFMLFAITTTSFGFFMIFTGGAMEMARIVNRGELDYFLTFPTNTLWHAIVSRTSIPAIGDLFFGLALFFIFTNYQSWQGVVLFLVISVLSALIFVNFIVITQSIGFFVGNFEGAAEQLFHALLGFTLYPQTVFHGVLKLIMFTVIPAFFIATLPVELMNNFSWEMLGAMFLFWLLTFFLAVWIFNRGMKSYESGNLINVKM